MPEGTLPKAWWPCLTTKHFLMHGSVAPSQSQPATTLPEELDNDTRG